MKKAKGIFNYVLIDGLSGMALGLFATLIVGTIIKQIGSMVGGTTGDVIYIIGCVAAALTSAGIGVGVGAKFKDGPMLILSAATAGMVGGYATSILAGTLIVDGVVSFSGPGEPLGAFIAAISGITIGRLVAGKTSLDILVTPAVTIGSGAAIGLFIGPTISSFMTQLGALVNWGTEQQPLLMGIVVSVLMGMFLTLPISSAAIGIILNLSGLAAGAATIGCCCNMVGFAVASYRENGLGGFFAQGIGTSMLQMPNIVRRPIIWLPAIISSAILGPIGTVVLHMTNNATGSGMGTAGLVGPLMTWQTMIATEATHIVMLKIIMIQFVLPAFLTLVISEGMRKAKWIRPGDMKLEV